MSLVVPASYMFTMCRSKVYARCDQILLKLNLLISCGFRRAQNVVACSVFQCMRI